MTQRIAGDFDYEAHGAGYGNRRRTDPRIAAYVLAALGDARTVVNVGAGAGSYEPGDREVTAVEPSAAMRAQRAAHLTPAVDATAQELPFPDRSFDAAMAMVTIHQWPDPDAGLRELRRYPAIEHIREVLGGTSTVTEVPVPIDCVDGFTEAFYARPEQFLDPAVRASQSAWGFVEPAVVAHAIANLRADLESGVWEDTFGSCRQQPEFVGSLRLVTALP
jgi:hypothetical protein